MLGADKSTSMLSHNTLSTIEVDQSTIVPNQDDEVLKQDDNLDETIKGKDIDESETDVSDNDEHNNNEQDEVHNDDSESHSNDESSDVDIMSDDSDDSDDIIGIKSHTLHSTPGYRYDPLIKLHIIRANVALLQGELDNLMNMIDNQIVSYSELSWIAVCGLDYKHEKSIDNDTRFDLFQRVMNTKEANWRDILYGSILSGNVKLMKLALDNRSLFMTCCPEEVYYDRFHNDYRAIDVSNLIIEDENSYIRCEYNNSIITTSLDFAKQCIEQVFDYDQNNTIKYNFAYFRRGKMYTYGWTMIDSVISCALGLSAICGSLECIKMMIEYHRFHKITIHNMDEVLLFACAHGHIEIVDYITTNFKERKDMSKVLSESPYQMVKKSKQANVLNARQRRNLRYRGGKKKELVKYDTKHMMLIACINDNLDICNYLTSKYDIVCSCSRHRKKRSKIEEKEVKIDYSLISKDQLVDNIVKYQRERYVEWDIDSLIGVNKRIDDPKYDASSVSYRVAHYQYVHDSDIDGTMTLRSRRMRRKYAR
jgi:hypothetical protein